MEDKIIQQIELENQQTLFIYDHSRRIAADAFLVAMTAKMDVKVMPDLFAGVALDGVTIEEITAVLGSSVTYEHRIERNFIMEKDRDEVLRELVKTFLDNLGGYVAKPQFPAKFVLKKYKDKTK